MAKMARDDDGLSPQESRAAVLRATGMSQAQAWRQAFNRPRVKPQTAWTEASKVFAKPSVSQRVVELLKAAKVQDIISVGEWGQMVLEGVEKARADDNMTAFFNGTRQLGSILVG